MNNFFSILVILATVVSTTVLANEEKFDYDKFVKQYHQAMVNTQKPNASKKDLDSIPQFFIIDICEHLNFIDLHFSVNI